MHEEQWTLEIEGSRRKAVAVAAVSPEGERFVPGDVVALGKAPCDYGLIAGFREEPAFRNQIVNEVRILILYAVGSIKTPKIRSEDPPEAPAIISTSVLRYFPVSVLLHKVTLGSSPELPKITTAIDDRGRLLSPIEFDPVNYTAEEIAADIASRFRAKFRTPLKVGAGAPGGLRPTTLFPRDKVHRSALARPSSYVAPEVEEMPDEETDDALDSMDESDAPPQKKLKVTAAKSAFSTPKKKKKKLDLDDVPALSTPRKSSRSPTKSPRTSPLKVEEEELEPKTLPLSPRKPRKTDLHYSARDRLHSSALPESLPCRENEFSQVFMALHDAVAAGTGTCVYVSGTPGVGKTATVLEAVAQLQVRQEDGELPPFTFLEINGMRLAHPNAAYEMLFTEITGAKQGSLNPAACMAAMEATFRSAEQASQRQTTVVLLDELDQMATKDQKVIYNFFNWPSLPYSKLIVIAVANMMDLPEQMANKINSRLGLTRISFRGYSYVELRQIVMSRLDGLDIVDADAVEYVARKIAGVSGDARRALDICRRAVELGGGGQIRIEQVRAAVAESLDASSSGRDYLSSLCPASKVLLCAVLVRVRRMKTLDTPLKSVLHQAEQLVQMGPNQRFRPYLYPPGVVRMSGFQYAISELVDAGILTQQALSGETTRKVRLNMAEATVKRLLETDPEVAGML